MNLETLAIQPTSEQSTADEKPKVSHHLSGDVFISIHTIKAQSLCQGSWEYNRMGLFQFAAVMTGIYQAHRLDDPYADWIIKKIEEELKVIDAAIKQASQSKLQ